MAKQSYINNFRGFESYRQNWLQLKTKFSALLWHYVATSSPGPFVIWGPNMTKGPGHEVDYLGGSIVSLWPNFEIF